MLRVGMAAVICVGAACASVGTAGDPALAERLEVIQTPASVVVGLRDVDLIMRRHPDLEATVRFLDGRGLELDTFNIDYAHEATRSHVVFSKAAGKDYARVSLKFADPGGVVLEQSVPLPAPVVEAGRAKLLDDTADLAPGTAFDKATAPSIRLPDYGSVQTAAIPAAERTVNLDECRKRVTADFNFPTTFARCPITNQTEFPDDNSRKSMYIPANNDLYNPETGAYESTFKYLIEIPVDPDWVNTDGEQTVTVPLDKLRLHMTTDKLAGGERITGNRKGGLSQGGNSTVVGADGNIYFALGSSGPIRFNVKKAAFEAPPVNLYGFYGKHVPAIGDLPYEKGKITSIGPDGGNIIFPYKRRIFVTPNRNAIYGTQLLLTGVISIPVDHWDDQDAFRAAMRLNAVPWPGTDFSLWDTHVQAKDHRRKMGFLVSLGDRVYIQSYHKNYAWVMHVAKDGSTLKLTPLTALNGKEIVKFEPVTRVHPTGLEVHVTLEGEDKPQPAFLPMNADAFTVAMPKTTSNRVGNYFHTRGWLHTYGTYGTATFDKYNINYFRLGHYERTGVIRMHYDAIERMRTHPGAFKDVIARMGAASMGPEYFAFSVPGDTMEILGVADYPMYNFARYDCSGDSATVNKTFLTRDMGKIKTKLNVPAKMGPYCYRWFREGNDDVLYYAGYTGIGRLVYRRQGKVLESHSVSNLGGMRHACVDGAPDGYIKWFRDIVPGLGDKVFVTGIGKVARGGTAYSGGLMYFRRDKRDALYKISKMSRSYNTTSIAARLKGEPGGKLAQDIFLPASFNVRAAETLPKEKRPANTRSRIFVYADRGASDVHDLFGFTIDTPENSAGGLRETTVSRNGLYLIALMGNGKLATLDLATWQFADAVKVDRPFAEFRLNHEDQRLMRLPDGRRMICVYDPKETPKAQFKAATFLNLDVDAAGRISLAPHLRCTFRSFRHLQTTTAFLYDSENNDGSYDLVFGPNWRQPEGAVRIIRDFLPPRPRAAAALLESREDGKGRG